MLKLQTGFRTLVLATSLVASAMITGCTARVGVGYRYDPYYHDRHVWDDHEILFYNQWADETHRDRNRDFRKLKRDEQKQYWDWRHSHSDKH